MRHLIPALVMTVVGFSTAHAAPADSPAANRPAPFGAKYLGEGGGYKHPDGDVAKYLETKPETPNERKPERAIPPKVVPDVKPIASAPSRARPRPFAPVPAKGAPAPSRPAAAEPSAPAPGADAEGAPLDSASEDARRDYEARLLGIAPAPRRPDLADGKPTESAASDSPSDSPKANRPSASTSEGMLFVSLELEPREAGALRDAVAGLGASAAFRPDARFQPLPGPGGSVRISGWLPAARLGDAIARPGVRRVEVERGSRPAGDQRVTGSYLVTLRVTDAARPEESVAESVRELAVETAFKLERVVAIESASGGGKTALVSGTMPVSRLARALDLRGIINIASTLPASAPATADSAAEAEKTPAKKSGFLAFVMARSLWLVLLTVLLALPTCGRMLGRALAVFVPYR